MPHIPIIMPQLGESIAEATVISFLVQAGDRVEADQDVLEVETNKATMNVTAPCPGRIQKFLVQLNESYPVGAVLGYLEASKAAPADASRRSWPRPLATVALPFALDPMLAHRKRSDPKPGPALYALRALALALAENSATAGRLVGKHIVHPTAIDVGFAVEAEDGVLVPVIRGAHKRRLSQLVGPYNELVELAPQRRLPPDATGGSIATGTNFGTFGLTWATPIPLPEQTLVLGMGAGRQVPNWDAQKKQFVPVTEANLTLSFDHRVLDGGAPGRLLARLAALLSKPEAL